MTERRQARRKPAMGQSIVLPVELVRRVYGDADASKEQLQARNRWFVAHGIDPADWHTVIGIIHASQAAHGLPSTSSLERSRRRAQGEGAR